MPEENRGERGGMVLDTPSYTDVNEQGDNHASLEKIEENNNVIDESPRVSNTDGRTENPEVGEDDQVQEGEIPEDSEIPGTKNDDRLSIVEKTLQEIHSKINQKPEETSKPLSDEDWAKLEQQTGAPRSTIEFFTNQNVKVVNKLTEYIDSKLAKLEFGGALSDFARTPGFQDANRYKKDVQDFLSAYDPKHWSNPELLKRAVIYSRGLNAGGNIQKARIDSERNRKIGGAGRPASPGGSMRKASNTALNQTQREAAQLMGSESEYNKYRPNGGRVVIE